MRYLAGHQNIPFWWEISNFEVKREYHTDMIFVFAWNEWAEGNLIEPDTIFNYELLKLLKKSLLNEQ